jgi:hypothetical protein
MVEFITYQGKKYPIRISYYVLEMVSKELGIKLDEIDSNIEAQKDILWYALVAGHKIAKKDLSLNREECVWILDECYLEFQKALFKFGQSLIKMQEELLKEAEDKKK